MRIPRVLVAGLRGGSGKTLVALGLEAAWRRQGLEVAPFKKGPDYIDAAWSTTAAGRPCRNLDLFFHSAETILHSFGTWAPRADIAVIEGNRGLYDGVDAGGSASTAELAKLLDAPVVLVVDCTKATRTVAAEVLGCQWLDPGVPIRGVILNRTGSSRQVSVIRDAIREATGLPVLGVLPRTRDVIPERHLGLVPPEEHATRRAAIEAAADIAERYLELDAIAALARRAPPIRLEPAREPAGEAHEVRIGVFRDAAFQFYYPENLEALTRSGATLVEVSPLTDPDLPEVDALYIGGGFPETLAGNLADNESFRLALKKATDAGLPVYAECGGAVYLGEELAFRGRRYPMAGSVPVSFGFREKPQGHGYTVVETVADNPFYTVGTRFSGHEFHYTYLESAPDALTFALALRRGHGFDGARDGLCHRNVLASYTHVHALAVPEWAPSLLRAAARFQAGEGAPAGVH